MDNTVEKRKELEASIRERDALIRRKWNTALKRGATRSERGRLKKELKERFSDVSDTQFYRIVNLGREKAPKQVSCPVCMGEGTVFRAWDMELQKSVPVRRETYMLLPETRAYARMMGLAMCQDCTESCPECEGEGKVTVTTKR